MKPKLRTAGGLAAVFLLLAPDISIEPTRVVPIQLTQATAEAQVGGRRRRTRRRTAVIVGTSVHAKDQQAAAQQQAAAADSQAAAADQRADAAEQQAAAAQQQPAAPPTPPEAAGEPLPVGTVVSKLPDGCTSKPVGGVQYYNCGGNYYRSAFQENTLVYVTTAPP